MRVRQIETSIATDHIHKRKIQCSKAPRVVEHRTTQVDSSLIQDGLENRVAELEVRLNAVHELHRFVQERLQEKVSELESQIQAVNKITVSNNFNDTSSEEGGSDSSIHADIVEKELKVPRCTASRIIGLKGSNIRTIKAKDRSFENFDA